MAGRIVGHLEGMLGTDECMDLVELIKSAHSIKCINTEYVILYTKSSWLKAVRHSQSDNVKSSPPFAIHPFKASLLISSLTFLLLAKHSSSLSSP